MKITPTAYINRILLLHLLLSPPLFSLAQQLYYNVPLHVVAAEATQLVKGIKTLRGIDTPVAASALASVVLDTSSGFLKIGEVSGGWKDAFSCLDEIGQPVPTNTLDVAGNIAYSGDKSYACAKDAYQFLETTPGTEIAKFALLVTEIGMTQSMGNNYHLEITGKCPTPEKSEKSSPAIVTLRLDCLLAWDTAETVAATLEMKQQSSTRLKGKFCEEAFKIFGAEKVQLEAVHWQANNKEKQQGTKGGYTPDQLLSLSIRGSKMEDMELRVQFPDVFQRSGAQKRRLIRYPDLQEKGSEGSQTGRLAEVHTTYILAERHCLPDSS